MLELYNVKKIYQTKTRRVAALDSVSFTLPEKGLVFILGRSGSGKTTMLNMLGGLDAPTEGELIVDGVSSRDFRQVDFDNYRNRYVGFVFQEYHLLDDYTVADNIALALELQGDLTPEERQQKIEAALAQVDLAGYGDRNTGELSGGQKQRVAIARALVKNPPMILADEPTGALDRKTGRQLFDLLKAVSKDKLVVVVSHDEDFAHEYADRILELEEGKIISDSSSAAKAEGKQTAAAVKVPHLGLSLKSVLNRGKITLRRKKWQISVISLLCVVSFLLMGVSDMLTSYDWKTTLISSLADEGVRVVPVTKESYLRYNMTEISDMLPSQDAVSRFEKNKFGMSNAKPGWQDGFLLRNADIQQLAQDTGRLVKGVYRPALQDMSIEKNYTSRYFIASGDAWKDLYAGSLPAEITGFMELEASDLEALGCTLVAGRLPDGDKKEIAISKYLYDAFALVGYKDYDGPIVELNEKRYSWDEYLELVGTAKFQSWAIVDSTFGDGNNYHIQKMEDMLGKTIFFSKQNFTIVGVVDTGFDSGPYAALTANDLESGGEDATTKLLVQELKQEKAYGMACLAFVGQGKIEALQKTNLTSMTLPNMTVSITDGTDEVTTHTIIQENKLVKQLLSFSDGKLEVIGIAVPDAFSDRLEAERGTIPPHLMENPDLSLVWKDGHITFKTNPIVQSANWKFGTMQYQYIYPFDDGIIVSEYLYNLLTEGRAGTYTYAVVSTPSDRAGIAKLVDDCYNEDGDVRYPMQGIVASQLNSMNDTLHSIAALFSRIDVVLIGFTMLLFTGYIFISIAQQKQAIGIMRALGAGIRDVFSIYFMEGILIAVIGCAVSIALLVVLTPVANLLLQNYLSIKLSILNFGFRQAITIVLLSFGIAFVASVIPILRIARQKPVDAIRKN